ncbi:MAG: hypothetical protein HY287_00750 [Planctomycetes bacterium]|nr:hypothetical protein [Planctomycetota bacterium]MBI3832837.1 hypothetical protein [Planctomycetota bacterium]
MNLNLAGTCDDGNACTTNDACVDGTCVGGDPVQCPEGSECVDGKCISINGP